MCELSLRAFILDVITDTVILCHEYHRLHKQVVSKLAAVDMSWQSIVATFEAEVETHVFQPYIIAIWAQKSWQHQGLYGTNPAIPCFYIIFRSVS
jgi:hypothetical protein